VGKGVDEKWDEETPSKYEINFGNCVNQIEVLDAWILGWVLLSSWPIVGEEVIGAIQSFFVSENLMEQVNSTIITLVPKKDNPFPPIYCRNVIYKFIHYQDFG
jgi:hypothetical protein